MSLMHFKKKNIYIYIHVIVKDIVSKNINIL